jgi:hypothetical protein
MMTTSSPFFYFTAARTVQRTVELKEKGEHARVQKKKKLK